MVADQFRAGLGCLDFLKALVSRGADPHKSTIRYLLDAFAIDSMERTPLLRHFSELSGNDDSDVYHLIARIRKDLLVRTSFSPGIPAAYLVFILGILEYHRYFYEASLNDKLHTKSPQTNLCQRTSSEAPPFYTPSSNPWRTTTPTRTPRSFTASSSTDSTLSAFNAPRLLSIQSTPREPHSVKYLPFGSWNAYAAKMWSHQIKRCCILQTFL